MENELRLLDIIAKQMSKKFYPYYSYDDIYQDGYFGLRQAMERYDSSKGVTFETFATRRIKGAIIDAQRKLFVLSRKKKIYSKSENYEEVFKNKGVMIDYDGIVDKRSKKKRIVKALKMATETQQKCFKLYYYKDLSLAQIGKKLGFSEVNASLSVRNAIEKVKLWA